MNTLPDPEATLAELRRCLHVLALPGEEALATLPGGCVKADELALDYSDALGVAENFRDRFSQEIWSALAGIDRTLSAMSGPDNAELWTDDAVITNQRWEQVRDAARSVLAMLGDD